MPYQENVLKCLVQTVAHFVSVLVYWAADQIYAGYECYQITTHWSWSKWEQSEIIHADNYNDVMMSAMASEITSLTIVY